MGSARGQRVLLAGAFCLLATAYSTVVPIFDAPDEPFHFEVARDLALSGRLPDPTDPTRVTGPEHWNPPLYYLLLAAVLRVVDPAAAPDIRTHRHEDLVRFVEDPVAGPRPVHPPLNPGYRKWGFGTLRNMFLTTEDDRFPFRGGVRTLHLLRLLSVLCGALTVWLVHACAATAFPQRPEVALLAGAIAAFTPQLTFLAGTLNNDNLAIALGSGVLLLCTRLLRGAERPERTELWLGLCLSAALLSKLNTAALLPVAAGAALLRPGSRPGASLLRVGVPLALVAGWFFVRSVALYGLGDPLGLELRALRHPELVLPPELRGRFFAEVFAGRLFRSWWGLFDWLTLPLPRPAYVAYAVLSLTGGAGALFAARSADPTTRRCLALLALALLLALAALVLLNGIFLSAQARLVFPAIAASSTLLAVGLSEWLRRVAPEGGRGRDGAVLGLVAALAAGCVFALVAVVAPVYRG